MNPFKDREDAMMWYYNTHSMPESPLPQSPQNIIDYSPPQQWQLQDFIPMQPLPTEPMPTEPIPTEPTEPAATDPATQKAPDHFVLDYNHPDGGYWKEGTESTWIRYPGGGYWSGGDIPDKAMEYYKSLENEGLMSSDSLLPIIPVSDSITTPLPDSGLLAPEEYIPETPDYSSFPPLDSYDFSEFESYVDSLPAGNHSYEGVVQDYIGRPLSPEESAMLSPEHLKLGEIRNLFGEPEDYTSNMTIIDPGEPSPPPNSDGLMGIVGGGIVDPGPVFDMQTAEGYEAYLNSL
jgi:hypothetical protein